MQHISGLLGTGLSGLNDNCLVIYEKNYIPALSGVWSLVVADSETQASSGNVSGHHGPP